MKRLWSHWPVALLLALLFAAPAARADTCGAESQRPCTVVERIPSCDLNLVEGSTGRCVRVNCGAEGQRPCGATERVVRDIVLKVPTPLACDVNLKPDAGVCVHPACGREGQRPCSVFERVPSCDANLMEEAGRCVHPPDCGREGQRPCSGLMARTAFGPCDVNLIPRNQVCVRPGIPDVATPAQPPAVVPAPATAPPLPPPPPASTVAGAMEADTDRMGGDVYGFPLTQAEASMCQSACAVNAQCQAWTFVKAGIQGPAAQCYLKNTVPAPTRNGCCVSGTKAAVAGKSGGLLKPGR